MAIPETAGVVQSVKKAEPIKKTPKRRRGATRFSTPKAVKAAAIRKARAQMMSEQLVQQDDQLTEDLEGPNNAAVEYMDDQELNENCGPSEDIIEPIGTTGPLQEVEAVEPEQSKGPDSRKTPQPKTLESDATSTVASFRKNEEIAKISTGISTEVPLESVGVIEFAQLIGINGPHESGSLAGHEVLNEVNGTHMLHEFAYNDDTGDLCDPSKIYEAEETYGAENYDFLGTPSAFMNPIESTGLIGPIEQLALSPAPSNVSKTRKSPRKSAPRKVMTANNAPKTITPSPRKTSKQPSARKTPTSKPSTLKRPFPSWAKPYERMHKIDIIAMLLDANDAIEATKAAHAEELARVYQEAYADNHVENDLDDDIERLLARPYPDELKEEMQTLLMLQQEKEELDQEIENRFSCNPTDESIMEAKCYQAQKAHYNNFRAEFDGNIAPGSCEDNALTILWGMQSNNNNLPQKRKR
ncbi:hypothetical protein BZA77DRAFT_353296 [Pyronema omphalodes]|nr:hypothetical protein BZA77DRAFT_353296 [Pyronema omphalodes]